MNYPENEQLEYKNYYMIFSKSYYKESLKAFKLYKHCNGMYKKYSKNHNKISQQYKRGLNYLQKKFKYLNIQPVQGIDSELLKEIGAFLNNNIQNGIHKSYIYIGITDTENNNKEHINDGNLLISNDNRQHPSMNKSINTLNNNPKKLTPSKICKQTYTRTLFSHFQNVISQWLQHFFIPSAKQYIICNMPNPYTPICIKIVSPKDTVFWTKNHNDKHWHVYIRVGSSSIDATPEEIYTIIKRSIIYNNEKNDLTFDCHPCITNKLAFNYLRKKCNNSKFYKFKNYLKASQNKYLNASLFFCDNSKVQTQLHIRGKSTPIILADSILKQIDEIIIKTQSHYKMKKFQLILFKEALINAYAHRSYLSYKQNYIDIYFYNTEIMISSPGIFPDKSGIKSIYYGHTHPFLRNPLVYYILHSIYHFPEISDSINKFMISNKLCPIIWCDYASNRTNILIKDLRKSKQLPQKTNDYKKRQYYIKNTLLMEKIDNIKSNKKFNKLSKRKHILKTFLIYKKHITHANIMLIFNVSSTTATDIIQKFLYSSNNKYGILHQHTGTNNNNIYYTL